MVRLVVKTNFAFIFFSSLGRYDQFTYFHDSMGVGNKRGTKVYDRMGEQNIY